MRHGGVGRLLVGGDDGGQPIVGGRLPCASLELTQDVPIERAADARAIAQALDACLPIAITDGLGGAIAGRPIALRLGWRKPATGV